MTMRADIENELKKYGAVGTTYTVSGADATISGNMNHSQIQELLDKSRAAHHEVKLVAGVLKVLSAS